MRGIGLTHEFCVIFSQRLGIELRRAPLASLAAHYPSGNPATGDLMVSLLTPTTADGGYQRNVQGKLLYQAHLVYYRSKLARG